MKRTMKWTAFSLSAAVLLGLAACGAKPTPTPTATPEPTQTPVVQPAEPDDLEQKQADEMEELGEPEPVVEDVTEDAAEDIVEEVPLDESQIRPEFKEAMDSYEQFYDEYVAFMQKYKENPSDLTLLADYASYMARYEDTMNKLDAIDEDDLTTAELAYYIEVNARIQQKLLTMAS